VRIILALLTGCMRSADYNVAIDTPPPTGSKRGAGSG